MPASLILMTPKKTEILIVKEKFRNSFIKISEREPKNAKLQ